MKQKITTVVIKHLQLVVFSFDLLYIHNFVVMLCDTKEINLKNKLNAGFHCI